jgi:hypothetical protein
MALPSVFGENYSRVSRYHSADKPVNFGTDYNEHPAAPCVQDRPAHQVDMKHHKHIGWDSTIPWNRLPNFSARQRTHLS